MQFTTNRSAVVTLFLMVLVLVPSVKAQTGRCFYQACNFNRATTPRQSHRLLTFLCRRCCRDIQRLNQAKRSLNRSLGLSPALREAAEGIRDVFQDILNSNPQNREGIANILEFEKENLQNFLETLEQGLERNVFDPLDDAIDNAISTAARATNIAEGLDGGWDLPQVIELIGAIAEEGGYALEIIEFIAAILLL